MQYSDIVATHMQTSEASPFQFEGTLKDGRFFYFKYRFGYATLKISTTVHGLVMEDGVSLEPRFELDAWMTRPEYEMIFVDMYHLHNSKYGDTVTMEA